MLVFLRFLMAGGALAAPHREAPDTASRRVVVRLEILTAQGQPYDGPVQLTAIEAKDASHLHTNLYGLCFTRLLSRMRYTVSVPGFPNFTSFTTPARGEGELSLELTLPESSLKGKTAGEGKGVVIFTYRDSLGRPYAGQTLYARADAGIEYRGVTDGEGVARLEVPLGDLYHFSVKGLRNFESHRFGDTPPIQTAEISLEWGGQRAIRPTAHSRRDIPRSTQSPRYSTHSDSLAAARGKIRASVKRPSRQTVAMPRRGEPTSPRVAKRIVEGVYMLRQAVIETERETPRFREQTHLELLRPMLRNRWENVVVVIDVTCSMDPYIEEYLLWLVLRNHASGVLGTVFFNDGDGLPDSLKRAGTTGGIREVRGALQQVADTMVRSIAFGCSGDEPENDLEALLYAQRCYPEASSIILIADNTSAVRDIELLSQLQMPVRVMLCGQREGNTMLPPHADYVTIAHHTYGSLHTLQEDFPMGRRPMPENAIRLGGWQYRYLRGRFIRE